MRFPIALLIAMALPQCAQSAPAKDALALLNEVSQQYADAKSYHIEAIKERTTSNDLSRHWDKTLLTAIAMPGGRYRYEGRSGSGSAILISDGVTKWSYHLNELIYTQKSVVATESGAAHSIPFEEMPATTIAKSLMQELAHRVDAVKSAAFLPDETISVHGRTVECYVVRYSDDNFRTRQNALKQEWTLWIDKSRKIVVKSISTAQTYTLTEAHARIPELVEETVTYSVVELGQQEPASSFNFVPPPEAKLVAEFPNFFMRTPQAAEADLTGRSAPELSLKSSDGNVVTLSSFHGKPVFIEFWATWCVACRDLEPGLKELYAETRKGELGWISIDGDDDQSEAATFVSREHILWPNYHDADGSLGRAFHRTAIPLGVLVDADRRVTFYKPGYEISDLRSAIAKLGPQFSSSALTGASSK
jgi:thiol-disulfide isomerase/thioredoxin